MELSLSYCPLLYMDTRHCCCCCWRIMTKIIMTMTILGHLHVCGYDTHLILVSEYLKCYQTNELMTFGCFTSLSNGEEEMTFFYSR